MKVIFALSLFLIGIKAYSQQKEYLITVHVKDAPRHAMLYLIKANDRGKPDTLQRLKVHNERVMFKGTADLIGELHFIKMDTALVKKQKSREELAREKNSWIRFMLDNREIKINSSLDTWPKAAIAGSKETESYNALSPEIKKIYEEFRMGADSVNDTTKILKLKRDLNQKVIQKLKGDHDNYATPLLVMGIPFFSLISKEFIYSELSDRVRNSFYGIKLKVDISILKMRSRISPGQVIPKFIVNTPEGRQVSILDLTKQASYTLIDFWASWCKPCRNQIPHLKEVYERFHSKGFNIVAVSSDESEAAWRKAMKEDYAPWPQGLQKNAEVNKLFDIASIPGYILIDHQGRMIAFSIQSSVPNFGPKIRGEGLVKTLDGLLNNGTQ